VKEERKEKMLNLLADRAVFGLNESETVEFEQLAREFPELAKDRSFEKAAAAFAILNVEETEALPSHLSARILENCEKNFAHALTENEPEEYQKTFALEPKRSLWNSLGWLVAAVACLALLVNIWLTRVAPQKDLGGVTPTPTVSPVAPSLAEQREALMRANAEMIKADWAEADPKKPMGITGDVVWSSKEQKGFLRLRNLPVNDKSKETYQLWIFDVDQDEKTPVDGGVFDVSENGEVIIPIDAKLKVGKPKMFAITGEKPGGVVVSKREHLMTIAKVAT
jgi:anti-sigma-K factor RskA